MNELSLVTDLKSEKVELITVNEKGDVQTVSARELYEKLDLSERFSKWWDRFCSYGFEEGIDYFGGVYQKVQGNQYGGEQSLTDYAITIEMAKQICMLQRSEKGKQYREYFLQIEKAWNSPEMVKKRALQIAQKQVEEMKKIPLSIAITLQDYTTENIKL